MKKSLALYALIIVAVSASAQFKTPKLEVGLGYAIQHQDGYGIPRFTIGLNEMFKGFGLYATPEYRGGLDPNEDYFQMPTGINYRHSSGIGVFAGGSLLNVATGKGLMGMRKELGASYVLDNGLTLRTGYSSTVGVTLGVGYQFATLDSKKSNNKPSKAKKSNSKPSKAKAANSKPSKAKAANSKPSKAKAANSKPSKAKEANSKPSKAKAANSKPSKAKAANSKPSKAKKSNNKPSKS
jgi:hypothetical protein